MQTSVQERLNVDNSGCPLVSVVVPVYGVERFIERCARSVFEQTYGNLEIIFVNDCTPDRSIEVLRRVMVEYPQREKQTQIIDHERNKGVGAARLTGLKAITGKYIIQPDSDDYMDHTMIAQLVDMAEKENADIAVCDFCRIDSYGKITSPRTANIVPYADNTEWLKKILIGEIHSSVWNKLTKKNLYFSHGIFYTEGLNQQEDLSVMYKLMYYAKKIVYLPQPLYFYSQANPGSLTRIKMNKAKQENNIQRLQQMDEFRREQSPLRPDLEQAFLLHKSATLSAIALYGDYKQLAALKQLFSEVSLRSIKAHPLMPKPVKLAGLFYKSHCTILLKLLRLMQKAKHHAPFKRN